MARSPRPPSGHYARDTDLFYSRIRRAPEETLTMTYDTPRFYLASERSGVEVFYTGSRWSTEYPDAWLYDTRTEARAAERTARTRVTPNTGMLTTLTLEEED